MYRRAGAYDLSFPIMHRNPGTIEINRQAVVIKELEQIFGKFHPYILYLPDLALLIIKG